MILQYLLTKNIAIKIGSAKVLLRDLTNINATSTELKFPDKLKTKTITFMKTTKVGQDSQKLIVLEKQLN